MVKYSLILFFLTFTLSGNAQKVLPTEQWIHSEVSEPSDICLHPSGKSFFVVSDNGFLYEVDFQAEILRQADYLGYDCEGVFADDNFVYVVEEMTRKVKIFDIQTLTLQRTIYVPYSGGRNKAYESITFNQAKGVFVLFTEKDPIYLFELNKDFQVVNEIRMDKLARDVSGVTFYNNHLWVLSDEDRTIFKLNPKTYTVVDSWRLNVVNPEGIAFDKEGNLYILSDDMERMYIYSNFKN